MKIRIYFVALFSFLFVTACLPKGAWAQGTLLEYDFNKPAAWPGMTGNATGGVTATAEQKSVGTVDVAGSTERSGGLALSVNGNAPAAWSAELCSGPLAVSNDEMNLGKLTWSFNLSVSQVRPVRVQIESYDRQHRRTGGLETLVYPAATDFYQRYAIDLSTMKAVGGGLFNSTDPFVGFNFVLDSTASWTSSNRCELFVDNVHYARAAFYISARGNDSSDGRTEQTALATPQKAVDAAKPGDIILLMEGTYPSGRSQMIFRHGGTPAAWVTVKNYPGQHPLLENETWNCICIGGGSKERPSTAPAIAYIEIRGLHVVGNAKVANTKYPELLNQSDPRTNGNGISVEGRYEKYTPHHLRFADNVVENNSGGGIGSGEADWVTIENNVSRDNCWWMIYAASGVSILGAANFDATEGNYKHLVRNNIVSGNQCFMKWKALNRYSDGNGIILDMNKKTQTHPNGHFLGRTLVQSNLSYNNGGGGIHVVGADHVDIINNTTYMNSASPKLEYAEIDGNNSDDVRAFNNILVAPIADLAAGEKPEPVNENHRATRLVFSHNIYFGGNIPPIMGDGDRIADPLFVLPSIDPQKADFRLQPLSPALGNGLTMPFSPIIDLYGKLLPVDRAPDIGAIQR